MTYKAQVKKMTEKTVNSESELESEVQFLIEQSHAQQRPYCENNAPCIFYVDGQKIGWVVQGCCNNWLCARCGHIRARTEYGKMIHGAKVLAEMNAPLYFHTNTCRGREMPLQEAEENWGKWQNHMLTSCRQRNKKQGQDWYYVSVTERQKREHPHCHIITTFLPDDAVFKTIKKRDKSGDIQDRDVYTSNWYEKTLKRAGLGNQYEITEVRSTIGVILYCAKYLFKEAVNTTWPQGWRRVRYSQSWPKNDDLPVSDYSYPLVRHADWQRLSRENYPICTTDTYVMEQADYHMVKRVKYMGQVDISQ